MTTPKKILLGVMVSILFSCTTTSTEAVVTDTISKKKALLLLMKNHDVPLNVDPSCDGVSTDHNDKTIGGFISGFWLYHTKTTGSNTLEVNITSQDKKTDIVKIDILRSNPKEEEEWSWGVSFMIDKTTQQADRSSFKCRGAG